MFVRKNKEKIKDFNESPLKKSGISERKAAGSK